MLLFCEIAKNSNFRPLIKEKFFCFLTLHIFALIYSVDGTTGNGIPESASESSPNGSNHSSFQSSAGSTPIQEVRKFKLETIFKNDLGAYFPNASKKTCL